MLRALEERQQEHKAQGTLTTLLLEPFVLHAECADVDTAQQMLGVAREAGFRESGISLGRRRVMLQVRTLAMRLEVPLAMDCELLIDNAYFEALVRIANSRLDENAARVSRLWNSLREALTVDRRQEKNAEQGEREPWVLVCPQSLARSVKLALEERAWLDESRKMQTLKEGAAPEGVSVSNCIGIPLTADAAEGLRAMAEAAADDGEDLSERSPAVVGSASIAVEAVQSVAGDEGSVSSTAAIPSGKKQRPTTVAADLEALWRSQMEGSESLQIIRSDVLPRKAKPVQTGVPNLTRLTSAQEREALEQAVKEACSAAHIGSAEVLPLDTLLKEVTQMGALQWRGDVALIPRGSLVGPAWEALQQNAAEASTGDAASCSLWERFRRGVGARLLARQQEIRVDDEVRGGNVQVLAGQGSGWVIVPGPRGVRYSFDVTKCMFSEGNAAEKERVASWDVAGETILDLYAGIGFWTLPLLVAGADHIFSCEWNPDAVEGLRRGVELLGQDLAKRCEVLAGDNRRSEVQELVRGKCDRVMLGLIPTSRDGFPVAAAALKPIGGTMHIHWNASVDAESATADAVAKEVEQLLQTSRGAAWRCRVTAIQRVKSFAPRVRHLRIDVRCEPVL
eukprot:TRINITY_DN111399_c0_g1_i1.p1 TRINITY_DN111399_c0_g1~~TRINITY_DN111399_c0_g1_i1.p1  ORF type:complete len:718 (-),score=150.95 TRINITY_DN111399_c0_g1_i1:22-1893(-)